MVNRQYLRKSDFKFGQYYRIVTICVVNTLEIVTVNVVNTLEIVTMVVVKTTLYRKATKCGQYFRNSDCKCGQYFRNSDCKCGQYYRIVTIVNTRDVNEYSSIRVSPGRSEYRVQFSYSNTRLTFLSLNIFPFIFLFEYSLSKV